jgi:hypothetical protein
MEPQAAPTAKKNRPVIIVIAIGAVACLCCCPAVLAIFYQFGDSIMNALGM